MAIMNGARGARDRVFPPGGRMEFYRIMGASLFTLVMRVSGISSPVVKVYLDDGDTP